jgi:hypothetical protein
MLPKVHSQVLIREEPDETYVIHMGTGKMYKFNQTAIAMLKACQEGITKPELIQRLTDEESDRPVVEEDIEETLVRFKELDIVK